MCRSIYFLKRPVDQAGTRWTEEKESNIFKSWSSDCPKRLLRNFLRTKRLNNPS